MLKATAIEFKNSAPQKIHRLENLAKKTGLPFSEKQFDLFTELSKHYGRIRYPDISNVSYNTEAKVDPIITKGKELYAWTRKKLQNH